MRQVIRTAPIIVITVEGGIVQEIYEPEGSSVFVILDKDGTADNPTEPTLTTSLSHNALPVDMQKMVLEHLEEE